MSIVHKPPLLELAERGRHWGEKSDALINFHVHKMLHQYNYCQK